MTRRWGAVALLLCAACGGGADEGRTLATTGPPGAQVVTVSMDDRLAFDPGTVEARVGKLTITVTNTGKVPHDLRFDGGLGATRTLDGGTSQPLTVVLTAPGSYDFVCTLHPGMDGTVVVTDASP